MKSTVNKTLYKVLIFSIKHIPIIILAIFVLGFSLNLLGITTSILTLIGGTSMILLALLYLLSYSFRFCYLHRLPLHYILASNFITFINECICIIESIVLLRILFAVGGLILLYYIVVTILNRNKPKPDYLKMFCERYCGC